MKDYPSISSRVRFKGNRVIAPCVGTVEAHYENGSVSMRPDIIPTQWPYTGYQVFAPHIKELTPVAAPRKERTMHKILVEAIQPLLDPTTGRMLVPRGTRFHVYGSLDCLTGDYGGVLFPVALHEIKLVQAHQ